MVAAVLGCEIMVGLFSLTNESLFPFLEARFRSESGLSRKCIISTFISRGLIVELVVVHALRASECIQVRVRACVLEAALLVDECARELERVHVLALILRLVLAQLCLLCCEHCALSAKAR